MTQVLNIENQLKELFPKLDALQIKKIENLGESFISRKGDLICQQGETCKGVLLVVNGKANIQIEKDGVKSIIHFLTPGETSFLHEAYLDIPYKTSCFCMETTLLFSLPKEELKQVLVDHPETIFDILKISTKEMELLEQRASNLISLPIKYRFIDSLLTLIKKFGEHKADHIYVPIKRDEIGSYINASKASLSRVVTELERSKLIKTSRQGIKVLDFQSLTETV